MAAKDRDGDFSSIAFLCRAQVLAAMGTISAGAFPIWWGGLIAERHYSNVTSIGLMQTAQVLGIFMGSVVLILRMKQLNRAWLASGCLCGMAAFFLVVICVYDLRALAVLYSLQAAAGAMALTLGTIYLGQTANPERQFSIQIGVSLVVIIASAIGLPVLQLAYGNRGMELAIAIPLLLGAWTVLALPSGAAKKLPFEASDDAPYSQLSSRSMWWSGVPIILAAACFASFNYNVYNFSERIASLRGLSLEGAGLMVSLASAFGILGSVAGFIVGVRFGRAIPIVVGAAIGCGGTVLLMKVDTGVLGFAVGMGMFGILYSLEQAYLYAQFIAIDATGQLLVIAGPLIALLGVVAASATLWVSTRGGIDAVLRLSLTELALSAILVVVSVLVMRNRSGAIDPLAL